jgi:hypothetical protein
MLLRKAWRPAVALALLAGCGSVGGPSDEAAELDRSGAELDPVLRELIGPEPTQLDIAGLIEGLLRGSETGEGGSP